MIGFTFSMDNLFKASPSPLSQNIIETETYASCVTVNRVIRFSFSNIYFVSISPDKCNQQKLY